MNIMFFCKKKKSVIEFCQRLKISNGNRFEIKLFQSPNFCFIGLHSSLRVYDGEAQKSGIFPRTCQSLTLEATGRLHQISPSSACSLTSPHAPCNVIISAHQNARAAGSKQPPLVAVMWSLDSLTAVFKTAFTPRESNRFLLSNTAVTAINSGRCFSRSPHGRDVKEVRSSDASSCMQDGLFQNVWI